jgi:DNA-binding transcriptional LysR family regulator
VAFDWNDLSFFLELARQGRLASAGRRLKVDHTTVSRRIAELERSLECKLFDRTQDGFVVTDAGQRLLRYAETIESNILAISQEVGGAQTVLGGTVRLATMEGIASLYLAGVFRRFHDQYPDILVELVTSSHLINVTKREADISLSFVKPKGQRLLVEKIGDFELRLYGSPDYLAAHGEPRTIDELRNHVFVDYVEDLISIDEVRWLHDVVVDPPTTFRSSSMIAQQNAAAAGLGLVLLPCFAGTPDPRLRPVLTGSVSVHRDIWLAVHEDFQFIARVKTVCRFLREAIAADQGFLLGDQP